ncbi:hypothetical protein M501DRAFT_992695 [Patellaria atrata CBS 101060]|uniref:Uncharacterized protein n=1 Tax=Patellaria atrata CBS 101060 TaxID=1346257 RepID=A0A9P4SBS9_9PEZI|nr:hypothetical protein M501DRAFT_992695 [Patellaria atrata CBS 101060]
MDDQLLYYRYVGNHKAAKDEILIDSRKTCNWGVDEAKTRAYLANSPRPKRERTESQESILGSHSTVKIKQNGPISQVINQGKDFSPPEMQRRRRRGEGHTRQRLFDLLDSSIIIAFAGMILLNESTRYQTRCKATGGPTIEPKIAEPFQKNLVCVISERRETSTAYSPRPSVEARPCHYLDSKPRQKGTEKAAAPPYWNFWHLGFLSRPRETARLPPKFGAFRNDHYYYQRFLKLSFSICVLPSATNLVNICGNGETFKSSLSTVDSRDAHASRYARVLDDYR